MYLCIYFEGFYVVCDPMVGGMMFLQRQMSLQFFQASNLTFALVEFVVEIYSKLRGSEIVSGSPKVIFFTHWIYLY